MHVPALIQDLALILAVAAAVVLLFHRIKQPVVLGYISAGVLVSGFLKSDEESAAPAVRDIDSIRTLAELGVIFLMFSLGLEFSFRKLARLGPQLAFIGWMETSSLFVLGLAAGTLLGRAPQECLFLGAMLAISSTTIIVKAFEELGLKTRRFAQTVLGVLIIEDLIAILLLVGLGTLSTAGDVSGPLIAETMGTMIFVVGGWFLGGYFLLPHLMKWVGRTRSDEILIVSSIALCLGLGVLGTRYHFSPALGAFIMGSILAESTESHRIEILVRPLRDLFISIFFVSVGMLIQPKIIWANAPLIVGLSILVIAGKFTFASLASLLAGKPLKTSILVGSSLTQIGEFSFIIATLGVTSRVIEPSLYPIIVAVSVLTTLTTPFVIKNAPAFADFVESKTPRRLLEVIDRYSRWRESQSHEALASPLEQNQWSRWLISGFVVALASRVAVGQGIQLISKFESIPTGWAPQVTGVLTALLCLPFLWRFLKGISLSSATATSHQKFLRSLTQFLALITAGALGVPFFRGTPLGLGLALAGVIAAVRLLRPLGRWYEWFESQFLSSFKDQPKTVHTGLMQKLAPWEHQLIRLKLHPDSEISGLTIQEAALRNRYGINIIAIQRGSRLIIAPQPHQQLFPKDELLVLGAEDKIEAIRPRVERTEVPTQAPQSLEGYDMRSIHIQNGAPCVGKTLREADFRGKLGAIVTGVERNGSRILNPDSELRVLEGDTLWVVGETERLARGMDFFTKMIGLFLGLSLLGACTSMPRYPLSDHYDGKRFFNPGVDNDKKLSDLMKWVLNREKKDWPEWVENTGNAHFINPGEAHELGTTWVGHATLLVQIGNRNILTDPIFSDRSSPVSFAGPKRVRPPGLTYDQLPKIHAVVISHNHYDHMDLPSLRELEQRHAPLFIVPLGNGKLLLSEGLKNVKELDWWESVQLEGDQEAIVTLTPSLHWCARGLNDRFETLWGAYFVKNKAGRSFYFAGDTGYHTHFQETFRRLGAPDLALLPIGAYEPRWFMKDNHMNPEDAVQAHIDLQSNHAVPMHYGTFQLTDEAFDEPLQALVAAKEKLKPQKPFEPIEVGGSWKRPEAKK
jgi:CPA2 family monovalent cation:H+ antiporter-2